MSPVLGLEGDYVLGLDVSHWQGRWDAQTAYDAGARFAFIKATGTNFHTGAPFTDVRFERNAQAAREAGFLVSFYHYLRPEFDVARQARYFCRVTQDQERHFPLIVDLEESGGVGKDLYRRKVALFCSEVEERTGQKAIIYTRALFWNKLIGDVAWAKEHLLWIALYTNLKSPWSALRPRYRPKPWDKWAWWQKSAGGNKRGREFGARSSDICLDVFNGRYEVLQALSELTMENTLPPAPEEPEPIPVPENALERLWRYAVKMGWEV